MSLEEAHEVWGLFDHEAMLDEMMERLEYRSFECPAYRAPKRFHRPHPQLAPAVADE